MKNIIINLIPASIGLTIGVSLYLMLGWWGFLLIFPWIGLSISIGLFIAERLAGKRKDLGRRIAILLIAVVFLIFLGIIQRENLQLEETVFYMAFFITTGLFTGVLIHYAIAKIFGPLIWGRGFCGWACWTAAIFEWLPIKENKSIPSKYGRYRYITLILSLAVPLLFIATGYNYTDKHLNETNSGVLQTEKSGQLIWFLIGNSIYYASGIPLAFIFKKKRAFCKILCPVSLVMKPQSTISLIRRRPTKNNCIECGSCNKNCPMDIDVMSYIKNKKSITSGECIQCSICSNICPEKAIR